MAVDYLSALNVGSGLNVTQIVDALVDAEKVPQESRIQKQLDERNISISSLGDVKSDLGIFKSNLDVYKNETGLVTESTNNSAVGVTNNGKIAMYRRINPFDFGTKGRSKRLMTKANPKKRRSGIFGGADQIHCNAGILRRSRAG